MNAFDKTQRIAIAVAIAVGVIGVVLTFSGIWALPSASNQRAYIVTPGAGFSNSQNGVAPQYLAATSSRFEELLKNGPPPDAVSEKLYLRVVEGSLPQLLDLEQRSLSQTEGNKIQEQIVQAEVNKIVSEGTNTLFVPEPHITIIKDKSKAAKRNYLAQIATLKEPLDVIASFFNNTAAISSKENLMRTAPGILKAYDSVISQGALIPIPADWVPFHLATMRALEKQRVGLRALYALEDDPITAVTAIQTLQDGVLEYITANKASLQQLHKEGF